MINSVRLCVIVLVICVTMIVVTSLRAQVVIAKEIVEGGKRSDSDDFDFCRDTLNNKWG